MEKFFEIGIIASTHGIKGTLKVFPTTESPERFSLLSEVIMEFKGNKTKYEISNVAYHKNMVLLTLKGINNINDAEKYKGARILIPDEQAIPLEENEYYWRDLYGMEVFSTKGEPLGTLTEIFQTGANDVYCVKSEEKKDLLIPAIKDCIKSVDVENKKMIVELMKGMLI